MAKDPMQDAYNEGRRSPEDAHDAAPVDILAVTLILILGGVSAAAFIQWVIIPLARSLYDAAVSFPLG